MVEKILELSLKSKPVVPPPPVVALPVTDDVSEANDHVTFDPKDRMVESPSDDLDVVLR
jgi:hypothetical protein